MIRAGRPVLRGLEMVKGKVFSVEQANGTLPLVRKIAEDIVEGHKVLHSARLRYREIRGQGSPTDEQGQEMRALEEETERRQEKLESCVHELEMIGCQLKDYEMGLIDFPAERDGKSILLCWKLGEEKVSHWHSLDGGYGGRQPLSV